ncbi:MAG: hypothetical protein IPP87_07835 [Ideonella sp.]|nr:hypothetical protein [Ideonella sp.]MBL0148636.1 hypothetical protein [Ideonella sp.]
MLITPSKKCRSSQAKKCSTGALRRPVALLSFKAEKTPLDADAALCVQQRRPLESKRQAMQIILPCARD